MNEIFFSFLREKKKTKNIAWFLYLSLFLTSLALVTETESRAIHMLESVFPPNYPHYF